MQVQSYLFFEGRCEEALEFYREAVGAEVLMMMRNEESPDPPPPGMMPPGTERKVMHVSFRIGDSVVMGSDGFSSGKPRFEGFALALTLKDEADAQRRFAALAEGGTVKMPLGKTFFSPAFGMLDDKFGIGWMIMVQP